MPHRHHDTSAGPRRSLTHRYRPITAPVTTGGQPHSGRPEPPSLPRRAAAGRIGWEALVPEGAPCQAAVHRWSSGGPVPTATRPPDATPPPPPPSRPPP